jgi:hypothetical protein
VPTRNHREQQPEQQEEQKPGSNPTAPAEPPPPTKKTLCPMASGSTVRHLVPPTPVPHVTVVLFVCCESLGLATDRDVHARRGARSRARCENSPRTTPRQSAPTPTTAPPSPPTTSCSRRRGVVVAKRATGVGQ